MPKIRTKVLIVILVLALIAILRERGIINLNAYKATISPGSSIEWMHGDTDSDSVRQIKKRKLDSLKKEIGISIIYKSDTIFKRGPNNNHIDIEIGNIYTGFLWTPLYKNAEFFSTGICIPDNMLLNNQSYGNIVQKLIDKKLFANKTIVISGICSHRTAMELIKRYLIKEFETQLWTDLAN